MWNRRYRKMIVLSWGYLYTMTLHVCNIQEGDKSTTRNLRGLGKIWERKNCTTETNILFEKFKRFRRKFRNSITDNNFDGSRRKESSKL